MTHFHGTAAAPSGFYVDPRHLRFAALEQDGPLPGPTGFTWHRVPAPLMLVVGPLIGLAYVLFLPLVSFVLLGRLLVEGLAKLATRTGQALARVLDPAWQPARAFFARRRFRPDDREPEPDAWSLETRRELEDEPIDRDE